MVNADVIAAAAADRAVPANMRIAAKKMLAVTAPQRRRGTRGQRSSQRPATPHQCPSQASA